jgi:SPX domain protein involved in polyphosphate accumulation
MKFCKKLEAERISEWAGKYVDYKTLKQMIKKTMVRVESLAVHTQYDPKLGTRSIGDE